MELVLGAFWIVTFSNIGKWEKTGYFPFITKIFLMKRIKTGSKGSESEHRAEFRVDCMVYQPMT